MADKPIHVIKLGGSLLDMPELPQRMAYLLEAGCARHVLLVVGGGRVADQVRQYDQTFRIAATTAHWLAIRAMQLNSDLLRALLPDCRLAVDPATCHAIWLAGCIALADPWRWLRNAERLDGPAVPHDWSFTSDSIAAHLAGQVQAEQLTLVKSTLPQDPANCQDLIDASFACTSAPLKHIDLVNLRCWPPQRHVLR